MKFDIFDKSSWTTTPLENPEKKLLDKALGAIGQKIHELKLLQEKIRKKVSLEDQIDYQIAINVAENNFEAAKQMEIKIEFPDVQIANVIDKVNWIIEAWKDKNNRASRWQELANKLQELQPYLDKDMRPYIDDHAKYTNNLLSVKVHGNEAWHIYLEARKCEIELRERINDLLKQVEKTGEEYLDE